MASSGYYYNRYKHYKEKAKKYEKNIKSLEKIKSSLESDFYDDQSEVNRELDELKYDLDKSVRHDATFSVNSTTSTSYKEKTTGADSDLKSAKSAIENEISDLKSKKQTAEDKRDDYYRLYEQEKAAEQRAAMEKLKMLIGQGGEK